MTGGENLIEKISCIGCGLEIQTEDSTKQGYLPKSVVEKSIDNNLICKRGSENEK